MAAWHIETLWCRCASPSQSRNIRVCVYNVLKYSLHICQIVWKLGSECIVSYCVATLDQRSGLGYRCRCGIHSQRIYVDARPCIYVDAGSQSGVYILWARKCIVKQFRIILHGQFLIEENDLCKYK